MLTKSTSSISFDKIEDLFRNRLVDLLARSVLDRDELLHWHTSATAIQKAIYRIDSYYETHRTLFVPEEQPMWALVESNIRASNGSTCFSVWKSFSELRDYGQVESRIHDFDIINPRELVRIVGLKSSDVRIARSLIWSYRSVPPKPVLDFWSSFDECGELTEDLADISEDGQDWNFNFWLYSYMAQGDVTRSVVAASETLRLKLSALEDAYMKLPTLERARYKEVMRHTLRNGRGALRNSGIVFTRVAHDLVRRYDEQGSLEVVA
jgi:hypothetical protein